MIFINIIIYFFLFFALILYIKIIMDMKKIKYFIFLNVFINYNIFCMNFDNFGPIVDLMKIGLKDDPNKEVSLSKLTLESIFGKDFAELSDKEKLLAVKNNIPKILKPFSPFLGMFGLNENMLKYLLEILENIDVNKIPYDSGGLKSYLASLILFSGEVSDDVKSEVVKKKDKIVILFHGMGDDAENFYKDCSNVFSKDYDIVSVEYNDCEGLGKLDGFIKGKVKELKNTISEYNNIYIVGHSLGCFVANKFRKKLIEEFADKKIHFIFHKGFYDLTKTPIYESIKKFGRIINLKFLTDEVSDNVLANLTSNYQLLKDFTMNTKFDFLEVKTGHNDIDLIDAFTIINSSEDGKNKVLFVYSENDNMVGAGGKWIFDKLVNGNININKEEKDENKLDEKPVIDIKEIMKELMNKNIEDISDDVLKEKCNLDVNIKEILKEGSSNVDKNNNVNDGAGKKTDSNNSGNPCCCFPCR